MDQHTVDTRRRSAAGLANPSSCGATDLIHSRPLDYIGEHKMV